MYQSSPNECDRDFMSYIYVYFQIYIYIYAYIFGNYRSCLGIHRHVTDSGTHLFTVIYFDDAMFDVIMNQWSLRFGF